MLVEAAQGGDRAALEALLRRHEDRVYALCRRITGNDHDACDATQEALIALVRGLSRFDGRARFSTWVYRVSTNSCLDELRRRRRRPVTGLSDESAEEGAGVGRGGAPADVAEALANRIDVDAALAQLAPEFRAAVVLRDLCDLDYADIAEVLDVPPGTVRSRIARGRAALAAQLGREPAARARGTTPTPPSVQRSDVAQPTAGPEQP